MAASAEKMPMEWDFIKEEYVYLNECIWTNSGISYSKNIPVENPATNIFNALWYWQDVNTVLSWLKKYLNGKNKTKLRTLFTY